MQRAWDPNHVASFCGHSHCQATSFLSKSLRGLEVRQEPGEILEQSHDLSYIHHIFWSWHLCDSDHLFRGWSDSPFRHQVSEEFCFMFPELALASVKFNPGSFQTCHDLVEHSIMDIQSASMNQYIVLHDHNLVHVLVLEYFACTWYAKRKSLKAVPALCC